MNKKRISMMLAGLMMFSNATSAFAMSNEIDQQIQGNSLLIGNYLFELDKNANSFDLDSFITSARSIADGEDNEVYYKDASGSWYELVEDGSMSSAVSVGNIDNAITMRNGVAENTDPNVLAKSDLLVSPATIVESTTTPGTFDTEVTVTIKASNNAKFATNVGATVDSISSASLVRTAPAGTNMQITRVDDKNIKLKLTGTASNHAPSVNTTEGSADNQKDFNENGTYGDIKFLMLPAFFTGVNTVAEGGQYVVLDVQFNDGAVEDRIINAAKAKMLTIENVDYGVLVLNEGNIDTYNFTLNGAILNPTKVNDSGTVVKFEMNRKQVAEVKLISKTDAAKTDTINIGSGTEAFTAVIKDQDPDRVLVSGPVSYFDYYLVDYDENGVIRSTLEKTTFDTENEGVTPIDKTVPALTLEKERTPLGDNIVINVAAPNSTLSKEWMANVYEVLKDYDTSDSARVPVQFSVEPDTGKITILAKSTAINDRHGHHEVVIKSNSFNDVHVNFELIEPAGDLYLSSNFNWWAHNELLFELKDFNYAVTNPIHAVYLDGEELTGDCEDYHVISNLVRLENGSIDKLTVGEHEIVIKIHGFEDYKRTFTLETAPNGAENPTYGSPDDAAEEEESASLTVDAVSAATGAIGGGSNGGSSDGSSGGGAIRANVIYDFDHISNAFILKGLDMDTPYVNKTINWWHSFTKDALIKNGSSVLMDYDFYKNNVGVNGQYKTFKEATVALPAVNPEPSEYMDKDYDKPAALYLNRPYSVKNMLHDSVMGETYYFNEVTATPAPSLVVRGDQVLYGNNVVIDYTGETGDAWAEALVSVKENSAYMKFDVDTNANTITFKTEKNSFLTGENSFVFKSEGFTTSTLKVEIYKAEQTDVAVKKDDDNNVIVGDFDADFMEHLGSISLAGEVLYNDSQYGNGKGDYEVRDNQIILRSKLFGDEEDQNAFDEQVTLQVNAEGYNTFVKNFTHEDLSGGKIEDKNVPSYVKLDDANKYIIDEPVEIEITDSGLSEYANAIDEVYLDGNKLASDKYNVVNHNLVIDGSLFTQEKDYTIKIVADKYKEIEFVVTINDELIAVPSYVTFEKDGESVEMGTELSLDFDDGNTGVSEYATAITAVVINDATHTVSSAKDTFEISTLVQKGDNTVTVKATNYQDKVFTVKVVESLSPAKFLVSGSEISETKLLINSPEEVNISLGHHTNDIYMDSIDSVLIDGSELDADKYELNGSGSFNKLILKSEVFSYGETYVVTIKSNNYTDATLTIEVDSEDAGLNPPEDLKLLYYGYEVNDDTITFADKQNTVYIYINDSEYEKKIDDGLGELVVDSNSTTTDKETVKNHDFYGNTKSAIAVDVTGLTEDNYNIVLKVDGYKDKTFNVIIDSNLSMEVPDYVGFGSYPAVNAYELTELKDVSLTVGAIINSTAYANAINSIEVENSGTTITRQREDLNMSSNLTIEKDLLNVGVNNVTVKSSGYEDYICTITVTDKNVPNQIGFYDNEDDKVLESDTLILKESKNVEIMIDRQDDYASSFSTIKIDGTSISDFTKVENSSIYGNTTLLTVPSSYFTIGESTNVTIVASGYKNLELTVEILETDSKLPVPTFTVSGGNLVVTEEYLDALTRVTFDGNELDPIPTSSSSMFGYKINFGNYWTSNGGSHGAGTYNITIEADGYEDYTGTITFN